MIGCEVNFDGEYLRIGDFKIHIDFPCSYIVVTEKDGTEIDDFPDIESAAKYCVEKSKGLEVLRDCDIPPNTIILGDK